jgi:hypothetical protein
MLGGHWAAHELYLRARFCIVVGRRYEAYGISSAVVDNRDSNGDDSIALAQCRNDVLSGYVHTSGALCITVGFVFVRVKLRGGSNAFAALIPNTHQ